MNGEDILFAMTSLGFENYAEALKIYLTKYREVRTTATATDGDERVKRLVLTGIRSNNRPRLGAKASKPGPRAREATRPAVVMPPPAPMHPAISRAKRRPGTRRTLHCSAASLATMGPEPSTEPSPERESFHFCLSNLFYSALLAVFHNHVYSMRPRLCVGSLPPRVVMESNKAQACLNQESMGSLTVGSGLSFTGRDGGIELCTEPNGPEPGSL